MPSRTEGDTVPVELDIELTSNLTQFADAILAHWMLWERILGSRRYGVGGSRGRW